MKIVKGNMVNEFCSSEDYDFYRRNNFGMHFSYYDAKNRLNTITIKVDNNPGSVASIAELEELSNAPLGKVKKSRRKRSEKNSITLNLD